LNLIAIVGGIMVLGSTLLITLRGEKAEMAGGPEPAPTLSG